MSMKRRAGQRKLRTREHVLADLSINHVERQILRRGFAVDRTDKTDYGIDLVMCTYAENGAVENGDVWFQVKATDHPELIGSRKSIRVRIEMAHLRHWLWEPRPVALVLYDGTADRAYWICVQKSLSRDGLSDSDTASLHIPISNRFDSKAVETLRKFKQRSLDQATGAIHYDDW